MTGEPTRQSRLVAGLWALHAGVNTGQVVQRDGDLFGSAVNTASRLATQAKARQVVATRSVVDQVGEESTLEVVPAGTVELKNISKPVELFHVRRPV